MFTDINNQLIRAVLDRFYYRFIPEGRVLWVSEKNKPLFVVRDELYRLGVGGLQPDSLPAVVINDAEHKRLALIDVADLRGMMTAKRSEVLKKTFAASHARLILVNAFRNRKEFQISGTELPWNTVVWFSDEPDHLIHFNGERLLGPYPDVLPTKATT